jgi:sister chromatid cohesion protein DCC1
MRPYNEETMNDGDNGDVDGDGDCDGLFTFEDLLERVQMSEMELREALDRLSAFPMGKFWRVADEALLRSVLDLIVLNSVQHDWSIRSLDEAQVVATLKDDGFPPRIVMHCLATFGQKKISGSEHGLSPNEHGQASSSVWELDQRLVCLHYAKQLLSSANPRWKLDDFLDAWRGRIPPGMDAPHLDMLRGEVLTEKMGSETWLRHFPVSKLPTNPPDRFAALFKERPRWEWQDLEPYVRSVSTALFMEKKERKTRV